MSQTITEATDVSALPLAPRNPLPIGQLVKAVRNLDAGQEVIRDAGGPVTRVQFGPKWMFPPLVAVFSPDGIRDVLGRNDAFSERCIVHEEVQHTAGDSLFVLPNEQWRPRKRALQPVFTKQNVRCFGGQMSRAAQMFVDRWRDGGDVDLDMECRRLTMQSLGRSVLGIDLKESADVIAEHMHVASVLHRRSRTTAGAGTAMVADPGAPPRSRRGRVDAPGHQRHPPGLSRRSDP